MSDVKQASLVVLSDSRHHAPPHTHPDAHLIGEPAADHPVRLVVVLRPERPFGVPHRTQGETILAFRAGQRARHATSDAAMSRVSEHARRAGLVIEKLDAQAHHVVLTGTLAQARSVFAPEHLGIYRIEGRDILGRQGAIHVPGDLEADIVAVLGYDARSVAKPHFRRNLRAEGVSYTPLEVAQHYAFPGTGTRPSAPPPHATPTIGLIELGGGYDAGQMAQYFEGIGVTRTGTLTAVNVAGGGNIPSGNPDGADGEVQLDIEVAGSIASSADLAVYFAPNQSDGFYEAISAAVHDTTNNPGVISISWGGPETSWSAQDLAAMDQAFQSAASLGITVCVASGDNGANDGTSAPVVDFPASSPHVLACGGTSLPKEGPEVSWNDGGQGGASGGGFSGHFSKPAWQSGNTQSMRGVPDVAGNADPQTGYRVSVDGQETVIGGTSAVAPLWAALLALCEARDNAPAGLIAPTLYANPACLNDIIAGGNNGYEAGPGWDPVTGLGSPDGARVAAVLAGAENA